MTTSEMSLILFFILGPVWLLIHNHFKNWQSSIINGFSMLVFSFAIINSQTDLLVLIGGWILGYVSDYIGVYCNYWKYKTESGYSGWVGIGWGLVTLIIYQMRNNSMIIPTILTVAALWILATHQKDWPKEKLDVLFILIKIAGAFFYPVVFLISFSWGIIIEYVAVEIFKSWKYKHISYLHIGLGYAMLLVIVVTYVDWYQHTASLGAILLATILPIGYVIQISRSLLKYLKK